MYVVQADQYDDWRDQARKLLAAQIPPEEILFRDPTVQRGLFEPTSDQPLPKSSTAYKPSKVPPAFLELAKRVACHRDERRWEFLYRVLWRLAHGENGLLEVSTDDDIHTLTMMEKQVRRDAHKMKAFVRFRRIEEQGEETFVAWHRPDHRIVHLTAPFFSRRFPAMHWTVLTPDDSVTWDLKQLSYGPGVPASEAPEPDDLEEMWKTYYRSTFNPARIKLKMMKSEMPVRHWPTLPETEIIPELLEEAPERVAKMLKYQEGFSTSAEDFFPDQFDYDSLCKAASICKACDLHKTATQTVFGHGPANAKIMMIGEQPGDEEDLSGKPFVGLAGKLLSEICEEVGLNREEIYITNAVKHFKFTTNHEKRPKKNRIHKKASAREITACKPWLEAELALLKPEILICLGSTAAQTLFGRHFKLTENRGKFLPSNWSPNTLTTYHPSAILRAANAQKKNKMKSSLKADLQLCIARLREVIRF